MNKTYIPKHVGRSPEGDGSLHEYCRICDQCVECGDCACATIDNINIVDPFYKIEDEEE